MLAVLVAVACRDSLLRTLRRRGSAARKSRNASRKLGLHALAVKRRSKVSTPRTSCPKVIMPL